MQQDQATPATGSQGGQEVRGDRPGFAACWHRSMQAPLETDAVDEQLQHADRVLAQMRIMLASDESVSREGPPEPSRSSNDKSTQRLRRDSATRRHPPERGGWFHALLSAVGWMAVYAGTTATMCGAVLVGLGILNGRAALTQLGWPIAMVGQAGLMLGLLLLLVRSVHDNRRARRRRTSGPHRRSSTSDARRRAAPRR